MVAKTAKGIVHYLYQSKSLTFLFLYQNQLDNNHLILWEGEGGYEKPNSVFIMA